ncbi:hypothetical protein [Halobacillus aidingensis]|uniref:Uncharacterized protein n=1 Tax=Halobacillus aidingensis TaxID=240303 RepID=A0A1H0RL64_HALAD|nr:hypothetical protein [Halobacillus aidingensis]SDP30227.1 hypothetical protein SAMN05421677_11593 [Halobacillus aidingensis]
MQAKNLNGGQELICMNVDKVYDWVIEERNFEFTLPSATAVTFLPTPTAAPTTAQLLGATVTCEVEPDPTTPIEILDRDDRQFVINGDPVTLQQLNIRKNFVITLTVTLADGRVFTSAPPTLPGATTPINPFLRFSRCEQVTLCAPEGTDVEVVFTDLDCFVCSSGTITAVLDTTTGVLTFAFSNLQISIVSCQSIQSTFPVTVEFLAEFCEPRDVLPTPCPAPIRPDQCPVVFPAFGNGDNGDNG